jgi:calpain-7
LVLSNHQHELLLGWKRPAEALPPPTWLKQAHDERGPAMQYEKPVDLVQDAAADCSVVASLCSLTARAARGHHKVRERTYLLHLKLTSGADPGKRALSF